MNCSGTDCKNPVKYCIVYKCGDSSDQKLSLCNIHYSSDAVFRRNIKKIVEIEK